ncbi:prenyltransferase, partial [Bacillus paralicheniformis]|nr:prenyltransferase [Bacillus paralicheniformis]
YAHAGAKARAGLLDRQTADGGWTDKWHASPYYATAHCVAALVAHGEDVRALDRAAAWVTASRRSDGGWGVWQTTAEETAYALQV